jgi:hypothetical protein
MDSYSLDIRLKVKLHMTQLMEANPPTADTDMAMVMRSLMTELTRFI